MGDMGRGLPAAATARAVRTRLAVWATIVVAADAAAERMEVHVTSGTKGVMPERTAMEEGDC